MSGQLKLLINNSLQVELLSIKNNEIFWNGKSIIYYDSAFFFLLKIHKLSALQLNS